jgi:hypothetical protein
MLDPDPHKTDADPKHCNNEMNAIGLLASNFPKFKGF